MGQSRIVTKLAGIAATVLWIGLLTLGVSTTPGQEPVNAKKPKKEKAPKPEKALKPDRPNKPEKIEKIEKIEKAQLAKEDKVIIATLQRTIGAETERDKWITTMQQFYPGSTVPDARGEIDFGRWFDALSHGESVWSLENAREKPLRELFVRVGQRLQRGKEPISREVYLEYANQYLTLGQSPPWKMPKFGDDPMDAIAKMFTSLDRNANGVLDASEITGNLKAVVADYDLNRNGVLEYEEYRRYFLTRMYDYRDHSSESPRGDPPTEKSPRESAPRKAPVPNLPRWYHELDDDQDGQVGLYEWRMIGQRPLDEFAAIDRDGDGLLTPYEIQCLARNDPSSPYLKSGLPSIPAQYRYSIAR